METKMNTRQKGVLVVGLLLLILMGLFPPWVFDDDHAPFAPSQYSFVLSPAWHNFGGLYVFATIDYTRLIIQFIFLAGAVWALILIFQDKSTKS